jgi:hypothetical protein
LPLKSYFEVLRGENTVVEILEYILVFAITAMMAGFSVVVVQGTLPVLHQTQGGAEFDELSGAASSAAVEGSATVVIPLSNATIGCSQGVIAFTSGGLTYTSQLGYPCSFAYSGVSCLCELVFSRDSNVVGLQVKS